RYRYAGRCATDAKTLALPMCSYYVVRCRLRDGGLRPRCLSIFFRHRGRRVPLPRECPLPIDDPPHPLNAEEVRSSARVEVRPPELLDGRLDGEAASAELIEARPHPDV